MKLSRNSTGTHLILIAMVLTAAVAKAQTDQQSHSGGQYSGKAFKCNGVWSSAPCIEAPIAPSVAQPQTQRPVAVTPEEEQLQNAAITEYEAEQKNKIVSKILGRSDNMMKKYGVTSPNAKGIKSFCSNKQVSLQMCYDKAAEIEAQFDEYDKKHTKRKLALPRDYNGLRRDKPTDVAPRDGYGF